MAEMKLPYALEILIVHRAADDDAGICKALVQKSLVDPCDKGSEDIAAAYMKLCGSFGSTLFYFIDIVLGKNNVDAVPEFGVLKVLF